MVLKICFTSINSTLAASGGGGGGGVRCSRSLLSLWAMRGISAGSRWPGYWATGKASEDNKLIVCIFML